MKGIDCATKITAATAAKLKAEGVKFAARYVVQSSWKGLDPDEVKILQSAGIGILSVFETTAGRPQGGAAAAEIDGPKALAYVKKLGQPEGSAIYFAVDFDVSAPDVMNTVERYLRRCAELIPGYKLGVYGEYDVIEEMAARGAADHFWQTYAWSGGKKSGHMNVYQYKNGITLAGITLDLNESYGDEGIWGLEAVKVEPPIPSPAAPAPDYPAELAAWKHDAIDWLYNQGLLTSDQWKLNPEAPLPLWAEAILIRKLYEKIQKGEGPL